MPSDYTHLHFGRKILDVLPDSFQKPVKEYKQLFEIGLQGPDILFFHNPFGTSAVSAAGHEMHKVSAKDFFERVREALDTFTEKDSSLAYLAGFLGHFVLDNTCHGYIENKIRVSGSTHSEIEKEFDRYLMEKDKQNGAELNSSASIVASSENAAVIACAFPSISQKHILQSLRSMRFITNMLSGKGLRRPIVNIALKASGKYSEMYDLLRPKHAIQGSEDSDLRLEKLMEKALHRYEKLALEYQAFLQGGDFPIELDATFGPGKNWRDIPVLTLEEERTYEV